MNNSLQKTEYSAVYARRTQPTLVDYPGKMAALFFTHGCNFRCGYCHNPDLLGSNNTAYSWSTLAEFTKEFRQNWVEAVTITGGEPTLQPQLGPTMQFFHEHGFAVKLDSNGSRPEVLQEVLPWADYIAMDIKCSLKKYPEFVGCQQVENIARSIEIIKNHARDYEFRLTLIEDFHDEQEIRDCAKLVSGAKLLVFQPFVPHENLPAEHYRTLPRTRPSALADAVRIAAPYVQQCVAR